MNPNRSACLDNTASSGTSTSTANVASVARRCAAKARRPAGRSALLALLAGSSVLSACASHMTALELSRSYYRDANFEQAYWVLEEVNAGESDDPVLNREYWKARLAYYLRLGQQHVFNDREVEGLAEFEKALALDPENEVAKTWIAKAKAKLAEKAAESGDQARLAEDLDQALLHYKQAIEFVPGHQRAVEGMQLVTQVWNTKREKARDHYLRGVRKLAEQLFHQALYHMTIAVANDPSLEAAERQEAQARLRLAEARFQRALNAAKEGHFGAAELEYAALAASAPDLPGVKEALADVRQEVAAERLARRGEMAMARGDYDEARKLLEEAYDKSSRQRGDVNDLLVLARERSVEQRYVAARDLELQNDLEQALEAYRAIETDWPGYLDVRTRISDLSESLRLAAAAYAAGEEAERQGDLQKAVGAYREALLFHPGFKDLDGRLEDLKARLRQQGQGAGGPGTEAEGPGTSGENIGTEGTGAEGAEGTGEGKGRDDTGPSR